MKHVGGGCLVSSHVGQYIEKASARGDALVMKRERFGLTHQATQFGCDDDLFIHIWRPSVSANSAPKNENTGFGLFDRLRIARFSDGWMGITVWANQHKSPVNDLHVGTISNLRLKDLIIRACTSLFLDPVALERRSVGRNSRGCELRSWGPSAENAPVRAEGTRSEYSTRDSSV